MKTSLLPFLFLITLISCNRNDTPQLGTFTESSIPDVIDECACVFSGSPSDYEAAKYLYIDNMENLAFVVLDGKMNQFQIKSTKNSNDTHQIKTMSNDLYELTIELSRTGNDDDEWQQQGTLTLKTKSGALIVKEIYGLCAC